MNAFISKSVVRFNLALCGLLGATGLALSAPPPEDSLPEACRRSDLEAVQAFLEDAKADVRQTTGSPKRTALHLAVRGRASQKEARVAIVRLLLDRGADPNAASEDGETVLQAATQAGWDDPLLDLLLERGAKIDLDGASPGNFLHPGAPLHRAVARGDVRLVNYLLSHGADANVAHHCKQETPLMVAFRPPITPYAWTDFSDSRRRDDTVEIVKLLVARGADVQRANADGECPLHYAAAAQHLPCLKQLLSLGASARARTTDGQTVLHYAAINQRVGDREIFQSLVVASGWTLNQADKRGRTPLHVAVLASADPAIQTLLLMGADASWRDGDGKKPMDLVPWIGLDSGTLLMLRRYTPEEKPPTPAPPLTRPPVRIPVA